MAVITSQGIASLIWIAAQLTFALQRANQPAPSLCQDVDSSLLHTNLYDQDVQKMGLCRDRIYHHVGYLNLDRQLDRLHYPLLTTTTKLSKAEPVVTKPFPDPSMEPFRCWAIFTFYLCLSL